MKKWCLNFLILGLSTAFAVGLGEGGLRIYQWVNPNFLKEMSVGCIQGSNIPGLYFELAPGCETISTQPFSEGVVCAINSCGFRGTEEECAQMKGTGELADHTIAVIGDSYTQACGVQREASFVEIAQAELESQGFDVELLNWGTGSYNSEQEFIRLQLNIEQASSDLDMVVWQFLLNDYSPQSAASWSQSRSFLREHSMIYKSLATLFRNEPTPSSYEAFREMIFQAYEDEENVEFIRENICAAQALLEENGIQGIFLYTPYHEMLTSWDDVDQTVTDLNESILTLAQDCGWEYVLSTEPMEQAYALEDLVLDMDLDHHLNELGNKIVGEALANTMKIVLESKPL